MTARQLFVGLQQNDDFWTKKQMHMNISPDGLPIEFYDIFSHSMLLCVWVLLGLQMFCDMIRQIQWITPA